MELVLIPGYKEIFGAQKAKPISELLEGIPSAVTLSIIGFINSKLHINQLDVEPQRFIFNKLIERMPIEIQSEILNNWKVFIENSRKHNNPRISIFPLITMLKFAEHELQNYRSGQFKEITPEQELNILKAILIFNEDFDRENVNRLRGRKTKNLQYSNEPFYRSSWPFAIKQYDQTLLKDFLKEAYCSYMFLDFLYDSPIYGKYLLNYLDSTNNKNIKTYIKKILHFYTQAMQSNEVNFSGRFSVKKTNDISLFNTLTYNLNTIKNKYEITDFKNIRKKPIVKHEDGTLTVINWNFFIEKLFRAFMFDFYNNSRISDVMNFGKFRSDIGLNFTQKILFESTLNNIFQGKGRIINDENDFTNFDYYLRIENKIIVFEFKDVLLNSNDSYELILKDINRKMVENNSEGKRKKKAVLQLIDHIDKIHNKYEHIDNFLLDGIDISRVVIFPIIVYTHKMWGMPGINDYLSEVFIRNIDKTRYKFFKIKELILMDFDHFLDCFDALKNGKIEIFGLFEKYYSRLSLVRTVQELNRSPENLRKSMLTFEEGVSEFKRDNYCHFHGSSLYHQLTKGLEIPKN